MSNIKLPAVQHLSEFVQFSGGMDSMSPPVTIPPGFARESQNFEEDVYGGYSTIAGYERFDGRASPSTASYSILSYSSIGSVNVNDAITGAISGAIGSVLAVTPTSLILSGTSGAFGIENITKLVGVTPTVIGASTGPAILNGEQGKLGALYLSLAADFKRQTIGWVPGTGNILGVWQYKGDVYAFRESNTNVAPALTHAVNMYKSSVAGWVQVPLGFEVYYTGGSGVQPAEGTTITQGTGGTAVSATLKRITVESGSFSGTVALGTAASGRMIFTTIPTPFTAASFTGGITATCVSQNSITIPNTGGRFNFVNANFYGKTSLLRMYGCDGANRAFEFDGTIFVPINTGLGVLDKPSHIIDHKNYLMLSVQSALLVSGVGNPYTWSPTLGAGEIDVSDNITALVKQPGDNATPALAIYCRNRTYILYGVGSSAWTLSEYNAQAGAISWSAQKIGMTYVFDDRGITNLSTTQNFGNFVEATISQRVQNWLKTKRSITSDSHIARDKQQYRLFFSDGTGVYWTLGANVSSMMPVVFPNPVLCSCSDETYNNGGTGGDELIYFGSSPLTLSGPAYVYQMERGTSHDGANILAYINLAFNNSKAYRMLKKYRRISFEMKGTGYAEFNTSYDLGYSSVNISQPGNTFNSVNLKSSNWDSPTWDAFIWDGLPLTNMSMSTPGIGENISLKIMTNGNYFAPVKFSGCFIEYSPQRQMR